MDYQYKGMKLTPAVFQELLIQLFDGKQFSRRDAIETIILYHVEHGGVNDKASYVATFKKATQNLKKSGIKNVGYGVWRLSYEKKSVEIVSVEKKTESINFVADKELGSGEKAVYVYYYEGYKKLAELQGKNVWECKIGRTDDNPISRIINQAGTCYPELPHIAVIFYCDDSSLLEKTFHSILKMKNKWLSDAPGAEWFITSPDEIERIYYMIMME